MSVLLRLGQWCFVPDEVGHQHAAECFGVSNDGSCVSLEEVEGRRADLVFNQVRDLLEKGTFQDHAHLVDRLLDAGHTPTDIASALFDMLGKQDTRESETIAEDTEPFSETARPPRGGPKKGGFRKKGGGGGFKQRRSFNDWDQGGDRGSRGQGSFKPKDKVAAKPFKPKKNSPQVSSVPTAAKRRFKRPD